MGKDVKLSVAIPYHGYRYEWTGKTIANIHNVSNVKEIIVYVDGKDSDVEKLLLLLKRYKKLRVFQDYEKKGAFKNKCRIVNYCKEDWIALIDSDNVIGDRYIQALLKTNINENVVYCPEAGLPMLRYSRFINMDIGMSLTRSLLGNDREFDMLINTGNYVFNRAKWIENTLGSRVSEFDPAGVDVAYTNYFLLKAGMVLKVLKGMMYRHAVHKGSYYLKNANESVEKMKIIKGMYLEDSCNTGSVPSIKPSHLSAKTNWAATGGESKGVFLQESGENGTGLLSD